MKDYIVHNKLRLACAGVLLCIAAAAYAIGSRTLAFAVVLASMVAVLFLNKK